MEDNTSRPPTSITPNILDKMYDYMDNMANAITNEKAVLEQLVATNAKQASTISTQATTILSLLDEVKKIQLKIINKGVRGGRGGKSEDVSKFMKGGY